MKILFIAPSFPTRLHRIRAWQLIETLSKKHTVHLLTLAFEPIRDADMQELQKRCASITVIRKSKWRGAFDVLLRIFSSAPFEVSYCHSKEMRAAAQRLATEHSIDLVYVKRLRSAQCAEGLRRPVVLDSTDAMSFFYGRTSRAVSFLEKPLHLHERAAYLGYEKQLAKTFKNWVVCSPLDAEYLRKILPADVRVTVIANGVDTDYFAPTTRAPEPNTLLMSGLLTKFVNIEAAEYLVHQILPILHSARPELTLYLVGPAGAQAKKLASAGVIVTGEVPDIREYIARASVVCVPVLTGAGTRNKILQAWSIGRPVVSTPQGLEGLEGRDERDLLIGKDPHAFAEQVLRVLGDETLRSQLVANGRNMIDATYAMNVINQSLEELLAKSV